MSVSPLSDAQLIDRIDDALASPGPAQALPGSCPDDARYWDLARGGLDPGELGRLLDHARACGECWIALRVAREAFVASGLPREGRRDSRPAPAGWSALFRPLPALAALALLAAAIPAYRYLADRPAGSEYRAPEHEGLRPLVADGAWLPRERFRLAWEPAAAGASYDVVLTTADLRGIFARRRLEASEVTVPVDALAGLPDGTRLAWRVDALLPDGTRQSSPARLVRLGGPGP
ncbi:MAG: hypothetical protein MUF27_09955 [Acidobacteria bacterium]|jgi:hypothetical protein|nr:hypothetical protein [Acidobacteriota bacterium]